MTHSLGNNVSVMTLSFGKNNFLVAHSFGNNVFVVTHLLEKKKRFRSDTFTYLECVLSATFKYLGHFRSYRYIFVNYSYYLFDYSS